MTDFSKVVDRAQTASEKWNPQTLQSKFGSADVVPLWIADMDFEPPSAVQESLLRRAAKCDLGYEVSPNGMFEAVTQWHARRHGWKFDQSHLCFAQSTLNAIAIIMELFTREGDGVIVQPPVYFQFQSAIQHCGRSVISNPLKLDNGRYLMDFADLEARASNPSTKILLLCNPHNPVGRVWQRSELETVAEICLKHHVTVISDEVHADFVYQGNLVTHFASLSAEVAQQTISCVSAAKTFSLPAIANSFAVIQNNDFRAAYQSYCERMFLNRVNGFTSVATEAAYRFADEWLDECVGYVQSNAEFLRDALRDRIPEVKLIEPEGTFMVWLDFRALELTSDQLDHFLNREARVALKTGHTFGADGEGFARMVIACPRSTLQEAVSRLETAVKKQKRHSR